MKAIINNTKCDKCGKYISQTLVRGGGLPIGSRDDKGKDAFFKELGIERG